MIDKSMGDTRPGGLWLAGPDRSLPASVADASPQVSIFVPVYNRETYLPETLDSLLAQTFKDFELIIADDGSTDGTLVVAQRYAEKDSRIRILELPHRGEVATRNAAVANASPASRYLMNHDSDDISHPTKLEALVAFLESNPQVSIVGCFAEYFDDTGHLLGQPPLEHSPERIRATFGQRNSMLNSTALIRREVFAALGGYREKFAGVDDYDFFFRALRKGYELANLPVVLHQIRLHAGSISAIRIKRTALLVQRVRADYLLAQRLQQGGWVAGVAAVGRWAARRTRAQLEYAFPMAARMLRSQGRASTG